MTTLTFNEHEPTGSHSANNNLRTITYRFGDYNIEIQLTDKNEFVGVENISIEKVFYNYNSVKAEHDVSKFYEE